MPTPAVVYEYILMILEKDIVRINYFLVNSLVNRSFFIWYQDDDVLISVIVSILSLIIILSHIYPMNIRTLLKYEIF